MMNRPCGASTALLVALFGLAHADTPPPVLYTEYPQPGEAEQIQRASQQIREIQLRIAKGQPLERGFHAKPHGCLTGTFKVLDTLVEDTKFGVFVPGSEYPVIARFSNASGSSQSDLEPDLRGLALKLDLGRGQVQDFLMTNGPVEFARDLNEMMEFGDAASRGKLALAGFFITHPKAAVTLVQQTSRRVKSLVLESYWSRVPFKIGPKAMKFNVRPCKNIPATVPPLSDTYLTDDLRTRLSTSSACFVFSIQMQLDPVAQPIEDPTVEWKESDTPSIPVAQVVFPAQSFDSSEQMEACQSFSYSPWHASEALRPIGNLNRARQLVYESSASFRGAQGVK